MEAAVRIGAHVNGEGAKTFSHNKWLQRYKKYIRKYWKKKKTCGGVQLETKRYFILRTFTPNCDEKINLHLKKNAKENIYNSSSQP